MRKNPKIPKLFYYGCDFSPLQINQKNNFDFKTIGLSSKKQASLSQNQNEQFNILVSFLKEVQLSIDDLITDESLENDEKRLFDYYNQQIYFGGLVGVVSKKKFVYNNNIYDITLQLNTRFDCNCESANQEIAYKGKTDSEPHFLMTLLFDWFYPLNNSKVSNNEKHFLDILLLYMFREKYKIAFNKGFFKTYHCFKNNDSRIRGNIDFNRHIKLNLGLNNGNVAYNFKEKSINNNLNQLIICAFRKLKSKYPVFSSIAFNQDLKLKNSLDILDNFLSKELINTKNAIGKNLNILNHPYFTEYEDVRKICIKILRDEKLSLFSGNNDDEIEGVLMYVPRLWEKFIEKHIKAEEFIAQKEIDIIDINNAKKFKQPTIPDFVLYKNNIPTMILDAKFKPGWLECSLTGKFGSLMPDYDKCIRDMVSINAKKAGVIFPTSENINVKDDAFYFNNLGYSYSHNISSLNDECTFYTFPIYVPSLNTDSLDKWRESFIESCNKNFKIINKIVS